MKTNPYYHPEKFGLKMLVFDEPDLSYEYNMLLFLSAGDGRIFTASDSGCSCPIPFEQNEGNTLQEVFSTMEQVGSLDQAYAIFRAWNKRSWDGRPLIDSLNACEDIRQFVEKNLR